VKGVEPAGRDGWFGEGGEGSGTLELGLRRWWWVEGDGWRKELRLELEFEMGREERRRG